MLEDRSEARTHANTRGMGKGRVQHLRDPRASVRVEGASETLTSSNPPIQRSHTSWLIQGIGDGSLGWTGWYESLVVDGQLRVRPLGDNKAHRPEAITRTSTPSTLSWAMHATGSPLMGSNEASDFEAGLCPEIKPRAATSAERATPRQRLDSGGAPTATESKTQMYMIITHTNI